MLQADSECECQAWINAIQAAVSKAYRDHSHTPNPKEEVRSFFKIFVPITLRIKLGCMERDFIAF
jgi:hypothetical protein